MWKKLYRPSSPAFAFHFRQCSPLKIWTNMSNLSVKEMNYSFTTKTEGV